MKQSEFVKGAKAILADTSGYHNLKDGQEVVLVQFSPARQCPHSSSGFIYPDMVVFEVEGEEYACHAYRVAATSDKDDKEL